MDLKSNESLQKIVDIDSNPQANEQNTWSSQIHEFNCGVGSSASKQTSDIDQNSHIIDFQAGSIPQMLLQPEDYETNSAVGLPALNAMVTPTKEPLYNS